MGQMKFVNVYIIDGRPKLSRPEAVLARSVDLLIEICYLSVFRDKSYTCKRD